ncbi:MAG: NAD(P)H-hydrate dehydratase [Bacteroidetes bacterium]|nr:NAD(P)H-hydrate dehydratase [Bacteroidota bacterium]
MKILTVDQIRTADSFTIKNEPISSLDLMEHAAEACVNWIKEKFDNKYEFKIVCGTGNNGGDGLAIARLLKKNHYKIEVLIINYSKKRTSDFNANLEKLKLISNSNSCIDEINSIESFQTAFLLNDKSVLIDALFGSGINKPIEGFASEIIDLVNHSGKKIISIDLPSGLYCDSLNDKTDSVVKATHTLSFQFPKTSFMYPETFVYVGDFHILDIGLSSKFTNGLHVQNYFTTKEDIVPLIKKREKYAHKGNFGHSLIIAGSYGKIGAAVLAAKSCLKSGTGLLTMRIPKCGYEIIQSTVPEAMTEADPELNYISNDIIIDMYNSIAVGPGLGNNKHTQIFLEKLIQNSFIPLVLDADAINMISENKTWLINIPKNSIFTPHLKEFERIAGKSANSSERLKLQSNFSKKYSVFVVLKGAHTSISSPNGEIHFNSTGNPGMAKGGSGDVLTGIITSLLAQGYSSEHACIIGVYIHGLAGDIAAQNISEESIIASDIIEHIGSAFKLLK